MAAGDVDVRNTTNRPFKGAVFDGINDYINVGNAGALLTNNFTIVCWVIGKSTNTRIISRREANTQWDVFIATDSGVLGIYDGTLSANGTINIADNKWHHCGIVINGAASQLYVDGAADGPAFNPTHTLRTLNTIIGAGVNGTALFHKGMIAKMKIYERPLTSAEMLKCSQNIPPTDGILNEWDLQDNYLDTAPKYTVFNGTNNGTYFGMRDDAVALAVKAQRVLTSSSGKFLIAKGMQGQVITAGITE